MKLSEIKDLSITEFESKVDNLKQELFNLRFQMATGQLDNPMRIRVVRRNIAQTKTILRERQRS